MQQMYDMIMQHKRAMQDMQLLWEKALQQHQHGYDSDEEVDSELGTWEHQLRRMEMDKTRGALGHRAGDRSGGGTGWHRNPHSSLGLRGLGLKTWPLCASVSSVVKGMVQGCPEGAGFRSGSPPPASFYCSHSPPSFFYLCYLSGQNGLSS